MADFRGAQALLSQCLIITVLFSFCFSVKADDNISQTDEKQLGNYAALLDLNINKIFAESKIALHGLSEVLKRVVIAPEDGRKMFKKTASMINAVRAIN